MRTPKPRKKELNLAILIDQVSNFDNVISKGGKSVRELDKHLREMIIKFEPIYDDRCEEMIKNDR